MTKNYFIVLKLYFFFIPFTSLFLDKFVKFSFFGKLSNVLFNTLSFTTAFKRVTLTTFRTIPTTWFAFTTLLTIKFARKLFKPLKFKFMIFSVRFEIFLSFKRFKWSSKPRTTSTSFVRIFALTVFKKFSHI